MRKWKFIGDHYQLSLYQWKINPVIGGIYTEDQLRKMWDEKKCVPFNWDMCRVDEDWQEVFEEEKVQEATLHKDTDLGYFAGLAMSVLPPPKEYIGEKETYDNYSEWARRCVTMAMALINQLNKETK